ncbi:hypothetical protein PTSG_09912 [Salpingoeca rosetta]|uniref:Acid ceramidase N-terminal domain-containing protein n=1 Tax=Salpingoeca rosetta (strain ATCC 50818 / BSB-021) TaxID=946362 RepID=F2UNH7_SALR5|nr:uncharacterized protein PTSG_09912 [Salpingoeca rosetta]EGD79182.1 hypothetical protein PTSG_09912 [Salpingoeca rosetta]|eukprot:XP_004989267.1 hypothetical protein PTSG_09912 [Salpingoeca rosetta]
MRVFSMAGTLLAVFLALVCLQQQHVANGAECHGKPDPNAKPNLNPIYTEAPVLVRSVKNAKLYTVGGGNDTISLVHLYGTPYEMGYAHGILMKENATQFINDVWGYLEDQVESAINGTIHNLQPWFLKLVADFGLDVALDLTTDATRPFTGEYFYEEMHGMADATGLSFKKIERIHMIGELTKGACSMYGAWGNATRSTNKTLQLRALDWDIDGPFRNFPQITVYHPVNTTYGHAFANIGWTGWIGSITGMNSKQMAISEIGVAFPDSTFGKESRFGIPFTYILRDILQFDSSLTAALHRITTANRTCDLILGVGDGNMKAFRGIQYSASVANFYTDTDNMPVADWHPRIQDVVYYGMDWLCPGYSQVLAAQLQKHHGNITPQNTIEEITAITQTGDLHLAVYDLTDTILYVANARRDGVDGPVKAYDRPFVRIDMKPVFALSQ